jgi:hypothetical protein
MKNRHLNLLARGRRSTRDLLDLLQVPPIGSAVLFYLSWLYWFNSLIWYGLVELIKLIQRIHLISIVWTGSTVLFDVNWLNWFGDFIWYELIELINLVRRYYLTWRCQTARSGRISRSRSILSGYHSMHLWKTALSGARWLAAERGHFN